MKTAQGIPVLMYHHVSPNPGLVTISPATFHAQIAWLAKHNYRSISTDDLAAFLTGKPLPEKSVMITFDDGYLDNYLYAHPILQAFGFKAVLFIITGWLGEGEPREPVHHHSRKVGAGDTAYNTALTPSHRTCMEKIAAGHADEVMLRWSEVAEMKASGSFEFHSHTHTHQRWDRLIGNPHERRIKLAEDLAASRAALEAHLGTVSPHLCWPQGYFDADYQAVAHGAGFTHLYTVNKETCTAKTLIAAIPRVVVKDRADGWFGRRLWLYRHPMLTRAYLASRGS
nr:B268 [uncultured bacterium]ART36428.1 C415 [uncultured bacterium]ART37313.1 E178 [uncultured bacterium]ART39345.1 H410 [uncultured bacterium]ART39661.1 J234 [uncultured bacterium]